MKNINRRAALCSLAAIAAAALSDTAHAADGDTIVVITARVDDFDRWKSVFDASDAFKRVYGWKRSTVFAIDGDRNHLMVMETFASVERAKAFATSPALSDAMLKSGVIGWPEIRFVTEATRTAA